MGVLTNMSFYLRHPVDLCNADFEETQDPDLEIYEGTACSKEQSLGTLWHKQENYFSSFR